MQAGVQADLHCLRQVHGEPENLTAHHPVHGMGQQQRMSRAALLATTIPQLELEHGSRWHRESWQRPPCPAQSTWLHAVRGMAALF